MFATAQELSTLDTQRRYNLYDPTRSSTRGAALTYDQAVNLLEYWGTQVKAGAIFSKSNRPWHLIDLSTKLDTNRPWVGFEFETGFGTQEELRDVMGWVWDNTMHSCMDAEGGGGYPVELTFAPDYIENYLEGKSDIHRLYAYLAAKKIRAAGNRGSGTHANISLPYVRSLSAEEKHYCASIIAALSNTVLQEGVNVEDGYDVLFGRNPYGWGAARDSITGHIEFKLFQSSPNVNVFNRWVRVTNEIVNLMDDWLKENTEAILERYGSWRGMWTVVQQKSSYVKVLREHTNITGLFDKHFRPIVEEYKASQGRA